MIGCSDVCRDGGTVYSIKSIGSPRHRYKYRVFICNVYLSTTRNSRSNPPKIRRKFELRRGDLNIGWIDYYSSCFYAVVVNSETTKWREGFFSAKNVSVLFVVSVTPSTITERTNPFDSFPGRCVNIRRTTDIGTVNIHVRENPNFSVIPWWSSR